MYKKCLSLLFVLFFLVSCSSSKDKAFIEADIKSVEKNFQLEEKIKKKFELKLDKPKSVTKVSKTDSVEKEKKKLKEAIKKKEKLRLKKQTLTKPQKKTIAEVFKKPKLKKISYPKGYPKNYKSYDKNSVTIWQRFKPKIYVGEEYLFRVSYLGITAGRIKLTTLPLASVGDEKVYHFRAQLRSARFYSSIYSLDDSLDSFVRTEEFLPLKYVLRQEESAQQVDDLQLFDHEDLQTLFWYKRIKKNANRDEHKKEFIPYYFQDSFSALHFVRGLPLNLGDIYEFPIMTRAKLWKLRIEVDREEILEINDERVRTLRLKAETRFPGVLKKRGDISFWYSNDEKRRLLKFEAEVKIGSIAGELEEYSPGEEVEVD